MIDIVTLLLLLDGADEDMINIATLLLLLNDEDENEDEED